MVIENSEWEGGRGLEATILKDRTVTSRGIRDSNQKPSMGRMWIFYETKHQFS